MVASVISSGAFFQVGEMVGALNSSSTLTFLEMAWEGSTRGRVYIRVSPDTSRGRQFVLLCSGQRGPSYLNTCLHSNKGNDRESVWGGDYECNNGKGKTELLDHPDEKYRKSGKCGTVASMWCKNKGGQFFITTRDRTDGGVWVYVIGEVENGLEVVREAANLSDIKQATVMDCGAVVPFL